MSWIWIAIFLSVFINERSNGVEGKRGFGPGEQDWGHVKVRPGAHMFWWLYYANPPEKSGYFDAFSKPLVIWLQGGPGSPSTAYGNFEEIGPLDINLQRRNYTWVNDYNVLFIDNPVGTGFSYVENDSKLATNNMEIAIDLLHCMLGFLNAIPQFQKVPTYILAESYGGKMATHFAFAWASLQKKGVIKSNLKGIGLGDSWISPVDSVLSYAPYLYYTGMINYADYGKIQNAAELTRSAIESQNWENATERFYKTWKIIMNCTNNIDLYNLLERKVPFKKLHPKYLSGVREELRESDFEKKLNYLMNSKVKTALSLKNSFKIRSPQIKAKLNKDFMTPVTDFIEKILDQTNLKVFVYNGQLDVIVPTASTVAWLKKLKWKDAEKWRNSKRVDLTIDNSIEGYVQGYKNLKMFWINRAGHMVPKDNYYAANLMLKMLTSEE
ncbi:retinoid-inducible serine carboxypeptidase-like [Microplitis mediator]|uniref:retinoid-inducible serine carboxypeptidase-like n=1 Tax=Microplitis mediator TaxID=375433 RepID=UPI0025520FE8|nr:retinoid-inducible serine carboxypeptidase-like [Microplitis mediator]